MKEMVKDSPAPSENESAATADGSASDASTSESTEKPHIDIADVD
jgi:hypothetical protein